MAKVYFIDVTNRDGVQAARIEMSKFQRTMVNHYLGQMGIYQSEFSFPFIWHEENYVRANLALAELGAMGDLVLEGWCRGVVGRRGSFRIGCRIGGTRTTNREHTEQSKQHQ